MSLAIESDVCPMCRGPLVEHRGWVIRRSGVWLRFRSRDCLAAFEGDENLYNRPHRDRSKEESPSSEWACY
jgi:Zn-finger nucleic acid-binding protein